MNALSQRLDPTSRMLPGCFEGVCVTTVILAPGACGGGLRAAVLDTTSVASVASAASILCSRRLDFVGRHRKR